MPTTCDINFENNPQKMCFPGQKLHITVRLKLPEEMKVRGIYIHLRGTAYVRFVIDDAKRSGLFTTDEDVLDIRKHLIDGEGDIQVIPMGTYDYSFSCSLPHNLPSSFSGEFGHIKYTATVVICIPRWSDKKFPSKFFIIKPLNLNNMPSLRNDAFHKVSQIPKYTAGIVGISARTTAAGYACGQVINLKVTVTNTTRLPVEDFLLNILRKTIYSVSADRKHQKTEYVVVNRRHFSNYTCDSESSITFPSMSIKVPPMLPPTDIQTSKIINISYLVSIKCVFDGYNLQPCKVPITIGTIPFDDSTSAITVSSSPTDIVSALPSLSSISSFEPSSSDFPDDDTISIRTYTSTPPPFPEDDEFNLPTYDEALLMNQDIDINLQRIEESFTKLLYTQTTKR